MLTSNQVEAIDAIREQYQAIAKAAEAANAIAAVNRIQLPVLVLPQVGFAYMALEHMLFEHECQANRLAAATHEQVAA